MPGKTFTIGHLGGGRGDIETHNKTLNGIKEKYQTIWENYVSDGIDKEIFNLIINKIFGF